MFTSSPPPPTSASSSQPHQRSLLNTLLVSLQYSLASLPFAFVCCQSIWIGRVFQLIGRWPSQATEPLFSMPADQLYGLLSQVAEGTLILSFVSSVLFPLSVLIGWRLTTTRQRIILLGIYLLGWLSVLLLLSQTAAWWES